MIRTVLTVALVIGFILGCATSSEVFLADGSKGYNISCRGAVMNFSHCHEKAGEICGDRGYVLVNQFGDAVPFATAGGGSAAFFGSAGTSTTRNIFVKCK